MSAEQGLKVLVNGDEGLIGATGIVHCQRHSITAILNSEPLPHVDEANPGLIALAVFLYE